MGKHLGKAGLVIDKNGRTKRRWAWILLFDHKNTLH
jgi:hypothetical protein